MHHLHHYTQHPHTIKPSSTHFDHQRPGVPGGSQWGDALCVKTIRIEDGTVTELADLFIEIFQGSILPNSTILLLRSVTSMLQQGSSGYLFDWLACAKKIGGR